MRPAVRSMAVGLLLATAVGAAAAQPTDELARVADADPSELARAAARLGDDAVIERLAADRPEPVRLAAVRAAPHLVGPEAAVAPLAELAAGRDPTLAPAAARALLQIAEGLSGADLTRREVELDSVAPALDTLDALAADETARADLRAVAAHVGRQLRGVLGP